MITSLHRSTGWLLCGWCLALAIICQAAAPASARPGAQATSAGSTVYLPLIANPPPTFAEQVVTLTNAQRVGNGCQPFNLSPQISAAAQAHSQDMALNDFISHTGSDGSSFGQRLTRAGYSWSLAAENIAAGQSTPAAIVAAWMGSPSHRANILNCALHDIGVGYYYQADDQANVRLSDGSIGGPFRHYWTQDFG